MRHLIGCLPYLAMLAALATYLTVVKHRTAWPTRFVWWPWVLWALHFGLHHHFDGVQNTTRNIARIYLLRRIGIGYDEGLKNLIQTALVPDGLRGLSYAWVAAQIGAFSALLFFQGWATALLAEACIFVVPGLIPLRYQLHLRQVRNHLASIDSRLRFSLRCVGVHVEGLIELVEQAIREKRNPQVWWGEVMTEAAANAAAGDTSRRNESPTDRGPI